MPDNDHDLPECAVGPEQNAQADQDRSQWSLGKKAGDPFNQTLEAPGCKGQV